MKNKPIYFFPEITIVPPTSNDKLYALIQSGDEEIQIHPDQIDWVINVLMTIQRKDGK